jgi:Cytochrome c554 and c-prime
MASPRPTAARSVALALTLLPLLPAPPAGGAGARESGAGAPRRFTFFYTAEVHGTPEPCGCTSDPLGDIARYATVVRAARRESGDVLLVDAGGLSHPEGGVASREQAGSDLRATLLATELGKLGLCAAGIAETDLKGAASADAARVLPRRLAVNLGASPALAPSVFQTANGIRVGVFGVADAALGAALNVKGDDPVVAGRKEADRLRKAGAEVVIALAPVDRPVARRLAREAAVDFVVLGRQVGQGSLRAEPVGRAFLLAPADELQKVGRVDVVLRTAPGTLSDAGGPEAIELRKAEIDQTLVRLDADLHSWEGSANVASSDPAFVAGKRRERDALAAERTRLGATTWKPPVAGNYFMNRLITLRRALPRDPAVAAAMRRTDAEIAKVNLRNAAPPPPPEPGRPFFVGMSKCAACHKPAMMFWRRTVHAHAWRTLVDGGKQADYKCVGCHVTGYGQVGGSSLGHTAGFENVQCETCHGPGSVHVAEKGLEEPSSMQLEVPSPTCSACHNEHHSDTFQYNAYLRDVLGPGHGMASKRRLGDGPTGHILRSAALNKAKAEARKAARTLSKN